MALRRSTLVLRRASIAVLLCLAAVYPSLGFASSFSVFGKTYVRDTGAPFTVTDAFSVFNPHAPYTLHVQNDGVASALIFINGVQVLGPSDFNPNVTVIDKSISLATTNEIAVQLRSKPGSRLVISIVGIDNDPPVIVATSTPGPNAFGWNNTNVLVTFTCSDKTSGVASCPSPVTVTSEGANQVIRGTAVDRAGNTASTSITINLDKSPPIIAAVASPQANAAGWNNTAVTVRFTCNDSLSGNAVCPSPVQVSTQGVGQVITGVAIDKAGNQATALVKMNIDSIPPQINASASPTPNASGWNNTDVTITFRCSDGGSGIATCPSPRTVSQEGTNQVFTGSATDVAGNAATASIAINLEKTPASITTTLSPTPNAAGWNNSNVTVSFHCGTSISGGVQCPGPQTVTSEGSNQQITSKVTDAAGNSATAVAKVNLDKLPPVITASASSAPNATGWNNSDVTVTFKCSDALSGISSCPPPQLVTAEGANQIISGTASDIAGNSATANLTLNIENKPPSITTSASPPANSAGWNNSNVTVNFQCGTSASGGVQCPAPEIISTEGANQPVSGTVTDLAGNTASTTSSTSATVSLDKTPPTLNITSPSNGTVLTASTLTVTGTVSDSLSGLSAVSCNAGAASVQTGSFSCSLTLTTGTNTISVQAYDVAGNSVTKSVSVIFSPSIPPSISATVTPAPNVKGWNNTTTTVSFTCTPGSSALASCNSPIVVSAEGANQSICGKALDTSGLSATACAHVSLDLTPPTITAAPSPAPLATGWNNTPVTVAFTCSDNLSGVVTCPPPQTVSSDGVGQTINGTVSDGAGNTGTARVSLNIEQTPPLILSFVAPSQISPGQSAAATVTASSLSGITAVVFQLDGSTVATLNTLPYTVDFNVSTTATAGQTLTLTVSVADAAGNSSTSSRGIQVALEGAVTGQVLFDLTSLPFAGASVQVVGGSTETSSDMNGRYSLDSSASHLYLNISTTPNASTNTPATVAVEREIVAQSGVGNVPVDARLTPLKTAVLVNPTGGTLTSGTISISVPSRAVSTATNFYLTPLSQQGLPELLPLGWSPIVAFDLRSDSSTGATFGGTVSQLPQSGTLALVRYDYTSHSWLMVAPNLVPSSGTLSIQLPSVGDFALVLPDSGNTSPSVPSIGQPLTGVNVVALPAGSQATGSLNPTSLSPSGGTAIATLAVQSSVPLPSGTVIQADVQENYSLTSGTQLSEARRTEDILLYQYATPSGAAAVTSFPVTPSMTFQPEQLSSGDVHLDILAGRESVRGQLGGSDPVTVTGSGASLTVGAGSLPQDTAISIASEPTDSFLPSTTSLTPLAEYNIDFSGQVLSSPAQLTVPAGSTQAGDNVVLAYIQRVNGLPYLVVVSLAQVNGTNLSTQAVPGLAGITLGGDYIFYKLALQTGTVSGTVSTSAGPVSGAIIQTAGLPFVAFSNPSGGYVTPAVAGAVTVSASVPNTALAGSASVQVTAGQTASANLTLSGQTEAATVTPSNGAVGVPLTAEIDITAPDAFNQTTVTTTTVTLTQNGQGTNPPVPVTFIFSHGGTRLSVFPQTALQPSTTYTLGASGVANVLGGLISIPTVIFTTQAITPPTFNKNALIFGTPDQNGNVSITAAPNSFPPGTTIFIIDQGNGGSVFLTVGNDGSVSGQIIATIDDVLSVTITAPDKTTLSFTVSQFVAADGTVAVGAGGGTIVGPGNTSLIISQNALSKGTSFKLTLLDQSSFPVLPPGSGLNFGSGLQVDAPSMPSFNKEVKLAFPVPANAPTNAAFYVFRRLVDQNGNAYFETIDYASVQGTGANAQVITASPPFCGYHNSLGALTVVHDALSGALQFEPQLAGSSVFVLMWQFSAGNPSTSPGLIVGLVQQAVLGQGSAPQSYQPYGKTVTVSLDSNPSILGVYQAGSSCPTFTIHDPQTGGGTRAITADDGSTTLHAIADEVNGGLPYDNLYGITGGLLSLYPAIGRVNFTFPATTTPPPSIINISISTLDSNGNPQPLQGPVQSGVTLLITFQTSSTLSVSSATINGLQYPVTPDPTVPQQYKVAAQYVSGAPGTYTIVAIALDPLHTSVSVSQTRNFLVVAAGGTNSTPTPGSAPAVIASTPLNNDQNVSTSVFPNIVFSEPVTNASSSNVVLADSQGNTIKTTLIGVRSDGSVADPVATSDAITSLTIQPTQGLEFNETYTLTLSSTIQDQNVPPFPLQTTQLNFTTIEPSQLGSTSTSAPVMTRGIVIGSRVYLGEQVDTVHGGLDIINISDPSNPIDEHASQTFFGRVMDIAGEPSAPVSRVPCTVILVCPSVPNGPLVAIAAGQPQFTLNFPSNVWLYDVTSPDNPVRVGIVSATTSSVQVGQVLRVFMKDQFLYTSTDTQGIQVIDMGQAVAEYQSPTNNIVQIMNDAETEGTGFATDAVVNTIPIYSQNYFTDMYGIKAGDFPNPASTSNPPATQTLVVATGNKIPLLVADPQQPGSSAILYPGTDPKTPAVPSGYTGAGLPNFSSAPLNFTSKDGTSYSLTSGWALALGTVPVTDTQGNTTQEQVAVIVGQGTVKGSSVAGVLAVVNLSDPRNPVAQGFTSLSDSPLDVVLSGTTAIVGTAANKALLFNINDPANPTAAGEIDSSSGPLGTRLAVTGSGLIVSTFNSVSSPGVQITQLNPRILMTFTVKNLNANTNSSGYETLNVTAPPDPLASDASPDSDFTFLAQRSYATTVTQDAIAIHASTIPPMDLTNLSWTVTGFNAASGTISSPSPSNSQGSMFSFVPNPPSEPPYPPPGTYAGINCATFPTNQQPPYGSCSKHDSLSYIIQASIGTASASVTITQDQKDVIRQEYVSHGIIPPFRSQFHPSTDSKYFAAAVLNNSVYSLIAGNPGQLADAVFDAYNSLAVTSGINYPFGSLPVRISSGWRNPERNEAVGGVYNSRHQFGDALDIVALPIISLPVTINQLYGILQNAAISVVSTSPGGRVQCEYSGVKVDCNTSPTIDHLHVERLSQ